MPRISQVAVVAVIGALGFHLAILPADAPPGEAYDVLIPPGEAGAYWDPGRMEGARIMLPLVLDPITMEPVPVA